MHNFDWIFYDLVSLQFSPEASLKIMKYRVTTPVLSLVAITIKYRLGSLKYKLQVIIFTALLPIEIIFLVQHSV